MLKLLTRFATGAVLSVALACPVFAASEDIQKIQEILFDAKHVVSLPNGTELTYKFERLPSDEKLLGLGFTDDYKMMIKGDGVAGKKNVLVNVFSGERAREPQDLKDIDGNPMLLAYLDTAVGHFSLLAGGDRFYFQSKFRKSMKEIAKLAPVKISYKGLDVDGYRVSIAPFADDPVRAKMRGYETAEFSIVLSDKIPGHFAQMISNFTNTQKDAPTLIEKTTLDGVGEVK
jgi:hypothetical protein